MNNLVSQGVVEMYPPLMDIEGSYSAQFEHVCSFPLHEYLMSNSARPSCYANPARRSSVVGMTIKVAPQGSNLAQRDLIVSF